MSKYASPDLIAKAIGSNAHSVINNIKDPKDDKLGDSTKISDKQNTGEVTELDEIPELRHWRDLGSYLDTLKSVPEKDTVGSNAFEISSRPLTQPINYRICNSCEKAILEKNMADHISHCSSSKIKKESANEKVQVAENIVIDDNPSSSSSKKEMEVKENSSPKKNGKPTKKMVKKRKSEPTEDKTEVNNKENTTEQPSQKKVKTERKKKEPKPKANKNKGPVDVERQCGVPLPNGGFCARSLTCKTHSMGAKRAVLGRSAPYDQLLAAYQRKNQAKLGAAAAAAQQAKDDLMHGAGVALDDEEETQQVLAGVCRSSAMPLERNVCIPVRMRTGYLRMREMFASSLLPRLQNNPLGKMYARAAVMNVENIDENSFFPVRSQHQKNNQQRQNLKHSQNAVHLQIQKQAQLHAKVQAQAQAQAQAHSQAHAQAQAASMVSQQQPSGKIPVSNDMGMVGNSNVLTGGMNISTLTPQQQQQQMLMLGQAQVMKSLPK